ncbi:MAG: peptidoglycan DD-metalloendopeptidase family protein [Emergencia sp.]|nr:peptidoglycan DD-metalloendopeptidase family protein [Emergencia sp.]
MDKEKKFRKIVDVAAGIITWHDEAQIRFDKWLVSFWQLIISGAAGVVTFHDHTQERVDRLWLIMRYHTASAIHRNRKSFIDHKKSILSHFAGFVLVAVAMVAMFNYATGFQYSYNGKVLGYVKNQEDVIKILDLVSAELSKEYGSQIHIEADENISFKNVVVLDKDIDDIDTVLKRLTYMTDMEAQAYGIYIDGQCFVICESKDAANAALRNVQKSFMDGEGEIKYLRVGFKENVEIRQMDTKLAYISGKREAVSKIMDGGSKEKVYVVKAGDTYSGITSKFDTTFEELKENNPKLKEDSLFPGDEILISQAVPALTVVTEEEATYAEKVKYKTEYREDDSLYENVTKVIQKGVNGKRVVTARIIRENGEEVGKEVLKTETIKKSVKKIVIKGTKKLPKTAPTGTFIMPVSGYTLTSEFGWRWGRNHDGLDLACPTGTPIHASDGGTVVYAGWYSGYGLFIEIDHGSGMRTRYGHCSAINVSVGDKVYQGQKIGEVGNTGNSYGSHCHFEIVKNGTAVDPFNYL